jgi:tetratricopeptide (TPR) repeat protein
MPITEPFSITEHIVIGLQLLNPYIYLLADMLLLLCIILFLLSLFKREQEFAQIAPILLTGLGIFSTLMIASIGISVFEPTKFDKSLPNLLNSLGIALIVGLFSFFAALIIRAMNNRIAEQQQSLQQDITPTVFYLVLKEISKHCGAQKALLLNFTEQLQVLKPKLEQIIDLQKYGFDQQVHSLEDIKHKLTDKNDNSLVTQTQLEIEKGVEKLVLEFRTLADKIATENIQAMASLDKPSQGFLASLEKSREALQEIAKQTTSIPQTMQQLAQLMQGLQQQLDNMAQFLESFQHLRQQAGDALPTIEKNVNNLTQSMQQVLQRNLELLETTLETQLDMAEASLETQMEGFQTLQNSFASLGTQIQNNNPEEQKSTNEALLKLATSDEKELPEAILNKEVNRETTKVILENQMDESLQPLELDEKINIATVETVQSQNEVSTTVADDDKLERQALTTETSQTTPFNPNDFEVLQDKAYTFMELERYEEAVTYFNQAIELNPTEFGLFYNQACCYALLEQVDFATIALQQAMSLNTECLEMAKTDSDFEQIRHRAEFQALLKM